MLGWAQWLSLLLVIVVAAAADYYIVTRSVFCKMM